MSKKNVRIAMRPRSLGNGRSHRSSHWRGVLWTGLAAGVGSLGIVAARRWPGPWLTRLDEAESARPTAHYVGSAACRDCHLVEAQGWDRSQHRAAMAAATAQTVLGNFGGARFTYAGTTSEFFQRDGKFVVRTDDKNGRLADFEVKYTFGVYPLQQYLVEPQPGRLQALSIAWDARPRAQGGQRWFHLYPGERITSADQLHWTRPSQNWNYMCADCHSTGVRKNYDASADRFQTKWAEISVGCEACHGPGSRHVAWAAEAKNKHAAADPTKGVSAQLDERRGVSWTVSAATGNATRSQPRTTETELEVCAQCHSRRSQIADGYEPGRPFLDYYRPVLLSRPLYHADGQQREEVYTWGSFLQSKMYAKGVTCGDCHDPHSGQLRAQGSNVCATCHLPAKYNTPAHDHHQPATAGVTCVACHMPAATYMGVDRRYDHSFRIPRPDLSAQLATPNACASCHADRGARWAAVKVASWRGQDTTQLGYQRFAAAFAAADAGARDAQAMLTDVAADHTQPPIARATALAELAAPGGPATLDALTRGLRDPSPLVRLGALEAVGQLPPDERALFVAPLLSDTVRALRIEAAGLEAGAPWAARLEQKAAFERAANEFVASQQYNADRPDARANLGTFFADQGDVARAEAALSSAIRLDRYYFPAYANLADVYRVQARDVEAERILRAGLAVAPRSAALHHALGLTLARLQRLPEALADLERAAVLEPGNQRFAYAYAVALYSTGNVKGAIAKLDKMLAMNQNDREALAALVTYHESLGQSALARRYADQLRTLAANGRQP